jgi:myo-inositol catabolism protein IolC
MKKSCFDYKKILVLAFFNPKNEAGLREEAEMQLVGRLKASKDTMQYLLWKILGQKHLIRYLKTSWRQKLKSTGYDAVITTVAR